jgi:hypothetical protein
MQIANTYQRQTRNVGPSIGTRAWFMQRAGFWGDHAACQVRMGHDNLAYQYATSAFQCLRAVGHPLTDEPKEQN